MRALLCVLAFSGCAVAVCRDGTLFVRYSMAGSADRLDVKVTVDGTATADHLDAPPVSGTIEVDFPNGYPRGKDVTIVLIASAGGAQTAVGSRTITAARGCGATTIALQPPESGADGSVDGFALDGAARDGAARDASTRDGPSSDGFGSDAGQTQDLATEASDLSLPPDLAVECAGAATRCTGDVQQQCLSGQWADQKSCAAFCSAGGCVNPPSCSSLGPNCGPAGDESCCAAPTVPGGSFKRSYDVVNFTDGSFGATVSPFLLDRFEVSVGRFRAFVQAYPASKPSSGAGKNPANAADTGWSSSWDSLLPADQSALESALACSGATWTATSGANESKPINCVDWYSAFAFCIWDGGRLASEAEWNFAASGGDSQRVYPWSVPASSSAIDSTLAVFGTSAPQVVGSHSPSGDGRWGQADLAGNEAEWTLDWYADPYPTTTCNDCSNSTAATYRVLRGGSWSNSAALLASSLRNNGVAGSHSATIGVRCARN